jgi:Tol biopolymer transport system component
MMRMDDSELVELPDSHGMDPAFHPTGRRIIFTAFGHRKPERPRRQHVLHCIRVEENTIERLTDAQANDTCAVFSPDGKQIAFCSDRDGFKEIYVMPYED